MVETGSKDPFFFSIDDTLSTKQISSKNIQGLKFNYSHVSNKNEWSHCIVSLHGHSSGLSLPLDFKTYLFEESGAEQNRSFKTKIELALDTLKGVDIQLKRKSYVLTDSWYTSAGFINEAQRLGFQVIGGIKSNRIFYPNGIRSKLSEYAKTLGEENLNVVTVKGRTHYVYRYEVAVKGIERFWELIYLLYDSLELKRFKSHILENLGELIDRLKDKRKREVISYVYEKALSGVKLEFLLKNYWHLKC